MGGSRGSASRSSVMPRAVSNPPNPWQSNHVEYLGEQPQVALQVYEEEAGSILSENDSPGRTVSLECESVPRLLSRVCVLLCTPRASVPRVRRWHRFRSAHRGQDQCPRATRTARCAAGAGGASWWHSLESQTATNHSKHPTSSPAAACRCARASTTPWASSPRAPWSSATPI